MISGMQKKNPNFAPWNAKKTPNFKIFQNQVSVSKHSQTSRNAIKNVLKRPNTIFETWSQFFFFSSRLFFPLHFPLFFDFCVFLPCLMVKQGKMTKNIRKQKEEKVVRTFFFFRTMCLKMLFRRLRTIFMMYFDICECLGTQTRFLKISFF